MVSKNLAVLQPGEWTNPEGKAIRNIILLSASDRDYRLVRPHLEYLNLPHHLIIHEAGEKLKYAYFPNRGLISLVIAMKDGKTAETGVVGNEGFSGTPAAVGLSRSMMRVVVQIAGDGFRVEVGALQATLQSTPGFQLLLCRYGSTSGDAGCADRRV
jgi:CRP-like cAMP-binding protein